MHMQIRGPERPHEPPQIDEELFKVTQPGGAPVFEGAGFEVGGSSVELWFIFDMHLFAGTGNLGFAYNGAHPLYGALNGGTLNEALVDGYYAGRPKRPTHKARLEYVIQLPGEAFFPSATEIGRVRVIKQLVNGASTVVGATFRQLVAGTPGAPVTLRDRMFISSLHTSGPNSVEATHEYGGFLAGAAFLTLCGTIPTPDRTVDVTFDIAPF